MWRNSSGKQVASYSYDAWGKIVSQSGDLAELNPIRYKGYYYDSDTGMYYLQSRYYDPALRKFINGDDPSLIQDLSKNSVIGTNLYAYCGNNGVNDSDQSGEISLSTAIKKIWNIVKAILPFIDILGIGLSIASYLIPGAGKIKFICKAICVTYYVFAIIQCITTLLKRHISKFKKFVTIYDLIVNATKAVLTVVSSKARKLANKLLKRKAYLITVIKAIDGVLGSALSLSRDMISIAEYCLKR